MENHVTARRWLLVAAPLALVLSTTPAGAHPTLTVDVPATVSGKTKIKVATTRSKVTRIDIFVDGELKKQCPAQTCAWNWNTSKVEDGEHRIRARAVGPRTTWNTRVRVLVDNTGSPGGTPQGTPVAKILGPLAPVGSGGSVVEAYDAALLDMGQYYAGTFPELPDDMINSNYYDLALVLYTAYYRTQDSYWRDQARHVARLWRDAVNNRAVAAYLDGDWSLGSRVPPPRGMATLGLALFALEAGDAEARRMVHLHARLIEQRWVNSDGDYGLDNPIMPMGDPREAGYGLTALVASTLLGEDHKPAARRLLNSILSHQNANGRWQGWVESGNVYTNNFMTGLLMESLAFYDRVIGDARILPAIERAMAWTWNTQWMASTRSFKYDADGNDATPAPALNGLFLPGWAHAYARTGKAQYREQAEQILRGLVDRGLDEIWGVKQFSQVYRSSSQYLGVR
jgi:hypothetical protein